MTLAILHDREGKEIYQFPYKPKDKPYLIYITWKGKLYIFDPMHNNAGRYKHFTEACGGNVMYKLPEE